VQGPNQGGCDGTANAHAEGQAKRIFICRPDWFGNNASHRAGIVIHEMIHKLGLVGDQGVTTLADVEDLARNNPKKAQRNPDTYEFLYQEYFHRVDAAVWRRDNNKVYLFSGNRYTRFSPDLSAGADPGYPKTIEDNWHGLPDNFKRGIDAAVWRDDNEKLYMFKGDQYVRFSDGRTTVDAGYPKPMSNWPGLDSNFQSGIDAAVWRGDTGRLYFFREDPSHLQNVNYVRYSDPNDPVDPGFPRDLTNWPEDLPQDFVDNLGAAFWHWGTGRLYLFTGRQYIRYSLKLSVRQL
jgi:hypothetical protein